MRLPFGLTLTRQKAAAPVGTSAVSGGYGWTRLWGHDFQDHLGSWQQDIEINHDAVLAQATVFACITLIASDIAKLRLRVVQKYGRVWLEKTTAGYSDLLNKPNHFQTRQQFVEGWIISKLSRGNTYVLKDRPARGALPRAMYVLDPDRVTPLVAPDGSVYYQLGDDDLAGVAEPMHVVPASEIIHDRFNCLFHPLVGLSPIFASGLAAMQSLQIQQNSAKFFKNQSRPSGILTAPKQISDETAARIKAYWEANYQGANKIGSVAVLGDSLSYTPMTVNAEDAQLVEQLKISAEQVCSTFHVPGYMVGVAPPPAQGGVDGEQQRYYNQCLQALLEAAEAGLDEGIGLDKLIDGDQLGTDFDLDGLLRMDSKTLAEVEGLKVQRGIAAPNEARQKFNLLPATGGESPMVQQQNYSLEALARRDASEDPFGTATAPAPPAPPAPEPDAAKIAADALRIVKDAEAQDRAAEAIAVAQRDAAAAIEQARAETATGMAQMVAAMDQRMQQLVDDAKAARLADAAARAAEAEAARAAQAEAAARREDEERSRAEVEVQSAKAFAALLMAEFSDA